MKVLIVGGGGREHTFAWACAKSADVSNVFVAPGNAGTASENKCSNVALDVNDFAGLATFARSNDIDLTIVGPEEPLVRGIKDYFDEQELLCLGPPSSVAQLEGSKSFAKDFMTEHGIPTAGSYSTSNLADAIAYTQNHGAPIVVKADGLAAGKGVVLAQTVEEAIAAITEMLSGTRHGEAGKRVVLEEFMVGEEASYTVLIDGTNFVSFASSQDHKAINDGDKGPNTGGMGAYSPAPVVTSEIESQILNDVIKPVVEGMRRRGTPYLGFLYAGLMITPDQKVKVVEFNCRFGDPETQVVLFRLESDFAQACFAAAQGSLPTEPLVNSAKSALCVVMASGGYPGQYETGKVIHGLDQVHPEVKILHAGTSISEDSIVTSGGRVLAVTSTGSDVRDAQSKAYSEAQKISWEDAQYRTDIGYRAIDRD